MAFKAQPFRIYDSDFILNKNSPPTWPTVLVEIAHRYVREYFGNFELMIASKAYLEEHGDLPNYRAVLNTLRMDINFQDLWNEAVMALPRHRTLPRPSTSKKVVPYRLKKPVNVHYWYATTLMKASKPVVHWVLGAYCEWYLNEGVQPRVPTLRIVTFCTQTGYGNFNLHEHRPTLREAWPKVDSDSLLTDCKACLRIVALENLGEYPADRNVLNDG